MDPEPCHLICLILLQTSTSGSSAGLIIAYILFALMLAFMSLLSAAEVNLLSQSFKEDKENSDESLSTNMQKILDSPRQLLVTILFVHTIISVSLIILGSFILNNWIASDFYSHISTQIQSLTGIFIADFSLSFFLKSTILISIIVIIGETIPKIYATINQNFTIEPSAGLLSFIHTLFSPLSNFIVSISEKFEHQNSETYKSQAREDIDTAIDLTVSSDDEKSLKSAGILKGIVSFGDKSVFQIMQAREDIIGLDRSMGFKQVIRIVKEYSYSRLPIFDEKKEKIVGIVYIKDLLEHISKGDDFLWQDLIRQTVVYVSQTKDIDELLKEFQKMRAHMAVVIDENNDTIGLVTLEDIMEEVVGEIKDEFDTDEDTTNQNKAENQHTFVGRTLLKDVCKTLNIDADYFDSYRGDADSLAGLVIEQSGSIPSSESELIIGDFLIKVEKHSNRRIDKISIKRNL